MSQQVRTLVWEIILLSLRIQISVGCKCFCYKLDIEASLIVNREAQIWDVFSMYIDLNVLIIKSDFPLCKYGFDSSGKGAILPLNKQLISPTAKIRDNRRKSDNKFKHCNECNEFII